MTDEEYFALPALSASQIKAFDKGAYWFWQQSPFNPFKSPDEETDALIFGKLCHCMLLEPNEVNNRFAVCDFGKSRSNKKYAEAKAQYPGLCVVTPDEYRHAMMMELKLKQHHLASLILDGATAEMPYTWTDKTTGLMFKQKTDAIKRTKNGIVVIDYKTSSDIQSVLNWPQKLQYPLQADFYCRGIKEKYGQDPIEFVFIIQSNKEGEEDVIAVANVEYETMQTAHAIVDHHISAIADKLKTYQQTNDASIWAAYPNRVEMRYSNWFMDRGEF